MITLKTITDRKNNTLRITFLLGYASFSAWVPVFTLWLEDMGLKGSQIGIIAAIPWAVMLVLQPIWGILGDRYGKVFCIRIALIASILGFALFPLLATHPWSIALWTFLASVFYTPILSLLDSIALDKAEQPGGISYSNIRFWGAPGFALGAMVTGWLIPEFGVQIAFYATACFLVMILLSMIGYPAKNPSGKSNDLAFKNVHIVLRNKILLGFLLVITIVSVGQSAITYYLPVYMRQIGGTPEMTGIALGIQALSELPFYLIATWLILKIGSKKVVLIAILATALRLFFYSINNHPQVVFFIETMNGITWTLLWISSVEFINEMIPSQWRTTGQSLLWAAYYGAGAIVGNLIIGRMYQTLEIHAVYGILSLSIWITLVITSCIFLSKKTKSIK